MAVFILVTVSDSSVEDKALGRGVGCCSPGGVYGCLIVDFLEADIGVTDISDDVVDTFDDVTGNSDDVSSDDTSVTNDFINMSSVDVGLGAGVGTWVDTIELL